MSEKLRFDYDVIVAGGGTAGWVAALEVARHGGSVLIIERKGYLGGALGSGLPIHGFFNAQRRQVVSGIAEEFLGRLKENGGGGTFHHTDLWFTVFVPTNPAVVKATIFEMLAEANIDILLFSQVVGVDTEGSRVRSVSVQTKEGVLSFAAKVFVDSTGDALICHFAGVPMMATEDLQPPTLIFRIENVDVPLLRSFLAKHPEEYLTTRMLPGHSLTPDFLRNTLFFYAFPKLVSEVPTVGPYSPLINRFMFSTTPRGDGVIVNMLRAHNVDGRLSESLSRATVELYTNLVPLVEFFRAHIPGFANCTLCDAEPEIQLRETRRIQGEYSLTTEDAVSGRVFADGIAVGGYYIDIHNSNDSAGTWQLLERSYEIPFRCLVPKGVDNIVAAGRCISGSKKAAGSYRVMATCMAMGQAAGLAAATSAQGGQAMRDLDAGILRERLAAEGAVVCDPCDSAD